MIDTTMMRSVLTDIANNAARLDVVSEVPKTAGQIESVCLGYRLKPKTEIIDIGNGMELRIGPVNDGVVMRKGQPKYWVLTGDNRVLASGKITQSKQLRTGVAWTMPVVKIIATGD